MTFFYRTISICLKGYFHIFYKFKVYGTNSPYHGKAILAANHASFLDPPVIGAAWPCEVHFVAIARLFQYKLWGWILSKLNAHPIRGRRQDIESFRLIYDLLAQGKQVVVFPEGSRSTTGELQTLQLGVAKLALRAKCPIIPVYITGTFEAWPRHRSWPKFGPPITCVFGKPIFPIAYENEPKKEAQEKLTQQIQKHLEELEAWLKHGAVGDIP